MGSSIAAPNVVFGCGNLKGVEFMEINEILQKWEMEKVEACKVRKWLNTLEPGEAEAIVEALQVHPTHTIWRASKKMSKPNPSGASSWQKHWAGVCSCPKN